jgi:hypothetical protein
MITELRLGPLNTDRDKEIAHQETENKLNEVIRDLNEPVEYYTRSEVDSLIAEIEFPETDLSNYYTRSEVDTLLSGVSSGGTVDLSAYYTKVEVNALIAAHDHDAADVVSGILVRSRLPSEIAYEDEANIFSGVISFGNNVKIDRPISNRQIEAYTSGAVRWRLILANSTPDGGADSGSDFSLTRFTDAGVGSPVLAITRSSGAVAISGAVTITSGAGTALVTDRGITMGDGTVGGIALTFNGLGGTARDMRWQTAGLNRWIMRASGDVESGGDTGSNFQLSARVDAGTNLDIPIEIERFTGGRMFFRRPVLMGSPALTAMTSTEGLGIVATGNARYQAFMQRHITTTGAPEFYSRKARGTNINVPLTVASADRLFTLIAQGSDGTNFLTSAELIFLADGVVGTGFVPGKVEVWTADAAGASTRRWSVDSTGLVRAYANLWVDGVIQIAGTQVVGPRDTGWTAWSGTASKAARDTATVTAGQMAEAIKAMRDAMILHGLIGA